MSYPAIQQTYAEIGISSISNRLELEQLNDTVKFINDKIKSYIPATCPALGKADYILGSARKNYITYRIWIDQTFASLSDFDAEEVIDHILSDVQMNNLSAHLQELDVRDTLTDGIDVRCQHVSHSYASNIDCPICDSTGVMRSTADGIVLLSMVRAGK